jgi:hypothetical protein
MLNLNALRANRRKLAGRPTKRRISRFPWRDRRRAPLPYAPAATPVAVALAPPMSAPSVVDCLSRSTITRCTHHLGRLVVATIASPGYEQQIADFFTTLSRYGNVGTAARVVLVVDATPELHQVCAAHGAIALPVASLRPVDASIKAALYSIPRAVRADAYLCCDSDILVVDDLRPLIHQVESAPGFIHAARSARQPGADAPHSFISTAMQHYGATLPAALELCSHEAPTNFMRLNSGIFAATAPTMMRLDQSLRNIGAPGQEWLESKTSPAADELLFSLAVARLGGAVEISKRWNLQLHTEDVFPVEDEIHSRGNHKHVLFHHADERAAILHFCAREGRARLPEFRALLELK